MLLCNCVAVYLILCNCVAVCFRVTVLQYASVQLCFCVTVCFCVTMLQSVLSSSSVSHTHTCARTHTRTHARRVARARAHTHTHTHTHARARTHTPTHHCWSRFCSEVTLLWLTVRTEGCSTDMAVSTLNLVTTVVRIPLTRMFQDDSWYWAARMCNAQSWLSEG